MIKTTILTTIILFSATMMMQEVSAQGMPLSIEKGGTGQAIPDWVRNNFEWYVNGQIDEKTLLTSMNWMFDNNVMHLSEKAAQEVSDLREENRQLKEKMKLVPIPIPEALLELPGFEPVDCSSNDQCHSDTVCRDGFCQKPCAIQCIKYDPVCGEDGKTYVCGEPDAACWGVDVDYNGECKRPDVSCPSGHIWIDCAQVCIPGRDTTCPNGMTMDPTTGQCRTDDSCPSGMTMDPTTGQCTTSSEQMVSPQSSTESDTTATPGQTFFYFVKSVRATHWEDSTDLLATIRGIDTTNSVDYLQEISVLCSIAMDKEIQALQAEVLLLEELTEIHSEDTTATAAGDTRYTGEPTEDKIAEWLKDRLSNAEQKIASLQTGVDVCEEKLASDDALTELTSWPTSQKKDLEEIASKVQDLIDSKM